MVDLRFRVLHEKKDNINNINKHGTRKSKQKKEQKERQYQREFEMCGENYDPRRMIAMTKE